MGLLPRSRSPSTHRRHSFAYEITGFTNALRLLVVGVRGEWTFAPDGTGTLIRWCYEFKPRAGASWLLRGAVAPLWKQYMQRALGAATLQIEAR